MSEASTHDGLTQDQIDAAIEVLDVLESNFEDEDMPRFAETVNESRFLIQQYEETADWVNYELPEVGDTVFDSETHNSTRMTVREVNRQSRADEFGISTHGITETTVFDKNPSHPPDAPVVGVSYGCGTGKIYHFPVTRLDW